MSFDTPEYLLFLPLVAVAFYCLPHRRRWLLLLAASYGFYAYWRPEYLLLLVASTLADYCAALAIGSRTSQRGRKAWLAFSLAVNLGFLIGFKYLGLLAAAINSFLPWFGAAARVPEWDVLLPIGISFYTFQSLGYTIDVYRGTTLPERHLGVFALYVSFFPQLVSGPIERSTTLLPQLHRRQQLDWDRIGSGLKLILWGLFQKTVVADRLALFVNAVFAQPQLFSGAPVLLSVYLFAFQVYFDFAGYTNMAIGSGRLLGFQLSRNFDRPYLASSIPEFWRRWHMSLTSWFRDYVFFSLGGSRGSTARTLLNVYIVFFLVAMWHGADWKLALFATAHFLFWVAHRSWAILRQRLGWEPSKRGLPRLASVAVTFHLVAFAWVIWWAGSLADVGAIYARAFLPENYSLAGIDVLGDVGYLAGTAVVLALCIVIACLQANHDERDFLAHRSRAVRWAILYALLLAICFLGAGSSRDFIYFQF